MSFSSNLDDHSNDQRSGGSSRSHIKEDVVPLVASLFINATFILAMIFEGQTPLETPEIQEVAVELISELPVPEAPEPPRQINPEIKPDIASAPRNGFAALLPIVADEEHKLKAPQGDRTIKGDGADQMLSGLLSESKDEQNSEKLDPDPDQEISRIIPPAAPKPISKVKPRIVPLGPEKKLAARTEKPDDTAVDDETAIKRKPIECGANAMHPLRLPVRVKLGQVLRVLTSDEAMRSVESNQYAHDLFVSPNYAHYTRLLVLHVDDWRPSTVILPPDMSVKLGDRVEYQTAHSDALIPCHYIPALVVRVM
jgi:hypothetical protein